MAAILNFEIFFQFFFQKAQLDPGRVIVWKFEGRRSNGLGAMDDTRKKENKKERKQARRKASMETARLDAFLPDFGRVLRLVHLEF